MAKLGFIRYHTSKEYRKLLKSSKINNITIKKENGKYYAIINIITSVDELKHTGKNIGIDFISIDLRTALELLSELTGESVTEDVINEIFSKFCIGK